MSAEASPALSGLDRESLIFTRYITGRGPTDYVVRKYQDGHLAIPFRREQATDPLDAALVLFSRRGGGFVRVADAYARVFRPHGILRQKLTLLLAVLEHAPPFYPDLTSGMVAGSVPGAAARITLSLLGFAGSLCAGLVLIGPLHLLLRLRNGNGAAR
ncbi:MAG: hypothetical protein ABI679_00240 [Gemmatimonadota bacterium]